MGDTAQLDDSDWTWLSGMQEQIGWNERYHLTENEETCPSTPTIAMVILRINSVKCTSARNSQKIPVQMHSSQECQVHRPQPRQWCYDHQCTSRPLRLPWLVGWLRQRQDPPVIMDMENSQENPGKSMNHPPIVISFPGDTHGPYWIQRRSFTIESTKDSFQN